MRQLVLNPLTKYLRHFCYSPQTGSKVHVDEVTSCTSIQLNTRCAQAPTSCSVDTASSGFTRDEWRLTSIAPALGSQALVSVLIYVCRLSYYTDFVFRLQWLRILIGNFNNFFLSLPFLLMTGGIFKRLLAF